MKGNGEYKIEKRVPLPKGKGHGRKRKYPFAEMKVGDSFSFDESQIRNVRTSASHHAARLGFVFTVSAQELRCWRVE